MDGSSLVTNLAILLRGCMSAIPGQRKDYSTRSPNKACSGASDTRAVLSLFSRDLHKFQLWQVVPNTLALAARHRLMLHSSVLLILHLLIGDMRRQYLQP
jgi:hypothetical protein